MAETPRIRTRTAPEAPGLAALPPLLQRIYAARGVRDVESLDYSLSRLPNYTALKGLDAACDLLGAALDNDHPILIVGVFDADGATSTALVCDALTAMGAGHVDHFIPHRIEHGYGLSPQVVAALETAGHRPGLLVTVDNGISSHRGVDAAHAAGWRVIVSDHHLPGESLPAADAIVNPNQVSPNQPGCGAFGQNLAGVGVAFYLMAALRARLKRRADDRHLPNMGEYLDLVALGTVADVVTLDHLNRLLVAQGLRRIRAGRCRPGITALIAAAGRDPARLSASDIGFAVGPRLNAAGRLDDMRLGVACLRAADRPTAEHYAGQLSSLNNQRRAVQARMQDSAEQSLAALGPIETLPAGLAVFHDDWHEGVVGLLAGKLRERYRRPVVAFARARDGRLKGSARSVDGLHIRDVLAAIAAADPKLIDQFGGHAQAAGLSLAPEHLDAFSRAFDSHVSQRLTPAMLRHELESDGTLADEQLNLNVAESLRDAGPWGAGFEEPLFHGAFEVIERRLLREKHLKMTLRARRGVQQIEAIAFNYPQLVDKGQVINLVYRLAVNQYRGHETANMIVEHVVAPRA